MQNPSIVCSLDIRGEKISFYAVNFVYMYIGGGMVLIEMHTGKNIRVDATLPEEEMRSLIDSVVGQVKGAHRISNCAVIGVHHVSNIRGSTVTTITLCNEFVAHASIEEYEEIETAMRYHQCCSKLR